MSNFFGSETKPKEVKEACEILNHLIKTVKQHQNANLGKATFDILFRTDDRKSGSKIVLASVRKTSGLLRYYSRVDYIIEIDLNAWQQFNTKRRTALIDHELCHCYLDYNENKGRYIPKLEAHDLTEFKGVVNRHGYWLSDLREFVQIAMEHDDMKTLQLKMDFNKQPLRVVK